MRIFSALHIVCLFLCYVFAFYCGSFRRVPPESPKHRIFSWSLFWILLSNELFWSLFRHFYLHTPLKENLPLHVSDFTFLTLLLALTTKKKWLCDLAFFAGTSTAVLGITFPYVAESGWVLWLSFPRYYITHAAIFAGGFYCTLGIRNIPTYQSAIRSYLITVAYSLLLIPLNAYWGTNYFYTNHAPPVFTATLSKLPWIVYYPGACLMFLVIFSLFWFIIKGLDRLLTKRFS